MAAKKMIDVLFVHPARHPSDYNIPMGLIGLMNSINCRKLGRMYFEVTQEAIAGSKIIVMDCHWFFPLAEIGRAAEVFKRVNPAVKIVVGGQTASVFAKMIVSRFKVDYVIRGDAEGPFPRLITELLAGRDGRGVPNVVGKKFALAQSYALTEEDYDKGDYLNIDWFPALKRRVIEGNKIFTTGLIENLGCYPFIPVFKGCKYDCDFCYGNQKMHKKLFKRGLVARKPEAVVTDLMKCSDRKDIKQVFMIADFVNILGEQYANQIFSRKYDLNLYYEFEHFNSPSVKMFEKILGSFNKCCFTFIFAEPFNKNYEERYQYLREILAYFKKNEKKVMVALYCNSSKELMPYYRKLMKVFDGLFLITCEQWFIPVPLPYSYTSRRKEEKYFDYWLERADALSEDSFVARSRKEDDANFAGLRKRLLQRSYFDDFRRKKIEELLYDLNQRE